uniref:Dienelactone hydrolase n=1 Tax=mine drainage metagenome TaxID=410659 RepID=E6QT10_9ZZZZ
MTKLYTKTLEYRATDGTLLEGYVAYLDLPGKPRPGILIGHDWSGVGDFVRRKAEQLAARGYVVLAADVYGKGIRPTTAAEASGLAQQYRADRAALRGRIGAAYDALCALDQVDTKHIVVMGYCFGGTTALELARSGADLVGTASFHGGLSNPNPQDTRQIRGKVLVMHGADDPFVPPEEVMEFKHGMQEAGIDMRFVSYPHAVHGFTNPDADLSQNKGLAYNAEADHASWQAFEAFLAEVAPLPASMG